MSIASTYRIKLPRPVGQVYRSQPDRNGLVFWQNANSQTSANRLAKALNESMRQSVKLRRAWEIVPGHIGVGHAGIAVARRKTKWVRR